MIAIKNVSKSYGKRVALHSVSFELAKGQTHVFLGSSGSGKSTLLRLICGLVNATSGSVAVNGIVVSCEVQRELALKIGYVIQEGGLFPHLTAGNNVALSARVRGWDEARVYARLDELAQLVQLDSALLRRFPKQLSGGERQRVALMRALMLDPAILLLDEPLGALDPIIRSELQRELKRIFNQVKKTVVLVTHDVGEGAFFGHTVSLFHDGNLVQHGAFSDLVKQPADEFVTRFISAQIPPAEVLELVR